MSCTDKCSDIKEDCRDRCRDVADSCRAAIQACNENDACDTTDSTSVKECDNTKNRVCFKACRTEEAYVQCQADCSAER